MATRTAIEPDIVSAIGQAVLMHRDATTKKLKEDVRELLDELRYKAERGVSGNHSTLDKLGELAFKIYGGPSCG